MPIPPVIPVIIVWAAWTARTPERKQPVGSGPNGVDNPQGAPARTARAWKPAGEPRRVIHAEPHGKQTNPACAGA
ncbi:MAG: hypothetical protein RLZZ432_498 [Chloroflexota bacterium]|jgi:hypothetical protein